MAPPDDLLKEGWRGLFLLSFKMGGGLYIHHRRNRSKTEHAQRRGGQFMHSFAHSFIRSFVHTHTHTTHTRSRTH